MESVASSETAARTVTVTFPSHVGLLRVVPGLHRVHSRHSHVTEVYKFVCFDEIRFSYRDDVRRAGKFETELDAGADILWSICEFALPRL